MPTTALLWWSGVPFFLVLLKHVVPALCIAAEPPFKDHHVVERYELIMLIFTGEIAFAVAAPGAWSVSACALLVMISCFLLHFVCVVQGRASAFSLTIQHVAAEQHRHILLFCALGGLGAGYTLAAHEVAHAAAGHHRVLTDGLAGPPHAEHAPPPFGGLTCEAHAHYLIAISGATFLIFSAFGAVLNRDPPPANGRPRLPACVRCAVRLCSGVATASLLLLPTCDPFPTAALVPALMLATALLELWGVQLKSERPESFHELS